MKRFALVSLLAAMTFGLAFAASATELKVKGSYEVMTEFSANLYDWDSDKSDWDNQYIAQRLRTYFTFQTNENLKAVLGLEMDSIWGGGDSDWGTDVSQSFKADGSSAGAIEIKHAYLDFNFPDTAVNVKAGLQFVSLPSVFGNPVFDEDAPAILVSAPINDMFGVTVGFTRGRDASTPYSATAKSKDEVDAAMLILPVTLDGFSATPYFAYAWLGENSGSTLQGAADDSTVWVLGANAALTMFDPLTFAADLIYGEGKNDDYKTKGWYAALAASYKMDMLTATLFGTYATGADDKDDKDNFLPTLAEGWGISPFFGGVRAFGMADDSYVDQALNVTGDGTGLWTIGLKLADISFVEKLSHTLVIAYAQGTSDKDAFATKGIAFTEKDHAWEVYFANQYMIYENLAAIAELGYAAPTLKYVDSEDPAYFGTVGFAYSF